jgi:hypothetical protein
VKVKNMETPEKPEPTEFYFELPAIEISQLQLNKYDARLLSCLVAAFRTGLIINQVASGAPIPSIASSKTGEQVKGYIKDALSTHLKGDKFISLRLLGPSLRYIRAELQTLIGANNLETARKILLLCIWRIFGVGNKGRLQELKDAFCHSLSSAGSLTNLDAIILVLNSHSGHQKFMNNAYGNYMVHKSKFKEILTQLTSFATNYAERIVQGYIPAFKELYDELADRKISTIIKGGLMPWLLCSDFSEYGTCHPPAVEDLVAHMTEKDVKKCSGPSGPAKALAQIEKWAGSGGDLTACLTKVMDVLRTPPEGMMELRRLVKDCEVQGRKLNVVDLEHGLCKISRMVK